MGRPGTGPDALLDVEVYLVQNAPGWKGADAEFAEALSALIDDYNALRKAKHYVILVAEERGPTGDVIGTFASLEDARTWAMTQPGGERYWQCSVRKPE